MFFPNLSFVVQSNFCFTPFVYIFFYAFNILKALFLDSTQPEFLQYSASSPGLLGLAYHDTSGYIQLNAIFANETGLI